MSSGNGHGKIRDTLGRPLGSLRISVTDRCNLRCAYCMPEEEYLWLPREDLLTFEEIATLTEIFVESGVERVRLTGGEPLLRRDLPELVRLLANNQRITDLAITTNAVLLPELAKPLRGAGLHRLSISLDTLRPERFLRLTRRDQLSDVLKGIEAADAAGFSGTKLDTVIVRGHNDDEIPDLLEFAKQRNLEVRFLEYMDVAGATGWSSEQVFTRKEMLEVICSRFGKIEALSGRGAAPAEQFRLSDRTTFGIIASTTTPFCRDCDRSRLTADGMWYLCLYATQGVDLRGPLRDGANHEDIKRIILSGWSGRTDRGAEERRHLPERQAFISVDRLRNDPHLEMHTRGG